MSVTGQAPVLSTALPTVLSPVSPAVDADFTDWLASYTPWRGRVLRVQRLPIGISNRTWRVDVGANKNVDTGANKNVDTGANKNVDTGAGVDARRTPSAFVVKMPGAGSGRFVDRYQSHGASRRVAALGIGAPVVDFCAPRATKAGAAKTGAIEIWDYLEGWQSCKKSMFAEPAWQAKAVALLRVLHASPLWGCTMTVFDMIDVRLAVVREVMDVKTLPRFEQVADMYQEARAVMTKRGLHLVASWNDSMTTNFMTNGTDLCLIDLEYAGNNDRFYDLAVWLGEINATPEQEWRCLQLYDAAAAGEDLAWVRLLRTLADYKLALWTLAQSRLSELPLDFLAYGRWKYARARARVRSRQWRRSLQIFT